MNSLNLAVKKVFDERSKFIVFGLTGRTGSGCSTTAELLANDFDGFSPPAQINCEKMTESDRQYNICHEYLKNNWGRFFVIKAADVISSFILEHSFDDFLRSYLSVLKDPNINIDHHLNEYKAKFEKSNIARLRVKEKIQSDIIDDEVFDFNFKELSDFTAQTRACLDGIYKGSYISLYQLIANNIRRSGFAYKSEFLPENIFKLAQRINSFVKILRQRQRNKGGKVFVCIDSLRNQFEVTYFRERYAAFYLVAVSVSETERRRRLREKFDYSEENINRIETSESPPSLKGEAYYFSQNVPKCIEMADIHLSNLKDPIALESLKKQLVRYVALVMHPGLVQPTNVERCMQMALNAKANSGCLSRQVGAVITDSFFSVKAIGWNDAPEGQERCSVRSFRSLLDTRDQKAYSDYELANPIFRATVKTVYNNISNEKLDGWPSSYCFKDIRNCIDEEKNQVHTRALHAEENAFLQITKYGGQGIRGGVLFTTSSPCELCAKKAYQLGIVQVYYLDPYPGISGSHVLGVGQSRPNVSLFSGAIGRGYQQLFDPIMPHKEALAHLIGARIPNPKEEKKLEISSLKEENRKLIDERDELKEQLRKLQEQ